MTQIELFYDNDRAFTKYCAFDSCDQKYVPVYFMRGKKKCFIINLTTEVYNDRYGYGPYRVKQSKEELEKLVSQLNNNDGKYFCIHSQHKNVWDFLRWVKESGYTFCKDSMFSICHGFYELQGNLNEYSSAFFTIASTTKGCMTV